MDMQADPRPRRVNEKITNISNASCDPDTSSSDSYSATTCHPSLLFALAASLSNDFCLRAFSLPWISTPMHSRMASNSRLARMGFNSFEPFVEQPYSFCRFCSHDGFLFLYRLTRVPFNQHKLLEYQRKIHFFSSPLACLARWVMNFKRRPYLHMSSAGPRVGPRPNQGDCKMVGAKLRIFPRGGGI